MRLLVIGLLVVVLDQATKLWVLRAFRLHESLELIPGLFSLTYITNTGAAFGMLAGAPALFRQGFFITVALAALAAIALLNRRMAAEHCLSTPALGLIAGGAVGNLIDRVRLGAVVDFLDFFWHGYHWPAFNVADSAITVGAGLFLLATLLGGKKTPEEPGTQN